MNVRMSDLSYRNGYRARQLYTRVGPVTLQVPQTRDGSFSTEIFKRYQRSEQAFVLALMEMVVNGVSTRKVTNITEELCGVSFSKSTVSQLCAGLDPNDDSALRLIGALLAEINEQWVARRYLDMDEFNEWLIETERAKENAIGLNKMVN